MAYLSRYRDKDATTKNVNNWNQMLTFFIKNFNIVYTMLKSWISNIDIVYVTLKYLKFTSYKRYRSSGAQ